MLKLIGYILYTIRPSACLMVGIIVVTAYRPNWSQWMEAILLFGCAFLGSAYCFIVNDIFDRKKDLLNNKLRPIATGKLPLKTAKTTTIIIGTGYLICAWSLNEIVLGLAIFSLSLFSTYSFVNRKYGLLSNLMVAFCASGALWGVAVLKDYERSLFILSGALFFMIVFREILLDWLDVEGDKASGKNSIPIQLSTSIVLAILGICLLAASAILLMTLRPSAFGHFDMIIIGLITSVWFPFGYLTLKSSRERVLFNIRFSHVSFILLVMAIIFR